MALPRFLRPGRKKLAQILILDAGLGRQDEENARSASTYPERSKTSSRVVATADHECLTVQHQATSRPSSSSFTAASKAASSSVFGNGTAFLHVELGACRPACRRAHSGAPRSSILVTEATSRL